MDYKKFDDQTLMRLASHQDENALGELYERFSRLVYSIALNTLNDPALAEEITQDVFLRVWKSARTYRAESGKVVTWMAGITRNRAIDEIRRLNVRPEAKLAVWEPDDLDLVDESMDVEGKVELIQQQNRVRQAISQLPIEQQQALAYAFFQGYSHREIAEVLNEPLGTIKTRIRLAMNKLRTVLDETGLKVESDTSKDALDTYS
jgi:RNA polymerase sigma-70 factor (ECF subfamily)